MKVVFQRVKSASVEVEDSIVGEISHGALILLGISHSDNRDSADYLVKKILNLRVFSDRKGTPLSLMEMGGSVLVVSQFTLYGNCCKGRKPSYSNAARSEIAEPLYEYFLSQMSSFVKTEHGIFGAHMNISLVNDGPVTLILEK